MKIFINMMPTNYYDKKRDRPYIINWEKSVIQKYSIKISRKTNET